MGLDPRILTEIMTRDKGRYMCKIPFFLGNNTLQEMFEKVLGNQL